MAKTVHPDIDIVKELPSLKYINNFQTTLWLVTRTLEAYQIGNAKFLKQPHTDETNCHQTSLINVVMHFFTDDDEFITIWLDGAIFAEDVTTENQSRAILCSFCDSIALLDKWQQKTISVFLNHHELISAIPNPLSFDIAHVLWGMISHDNCNPARALGIQIQSIMLKLENNDSTTKKECIVY